VGVAVPRGSYDGGYRPYPYRSYGHYPRYDYPYAYYPRYYSYLGYAGPFSWGFGFDIGFGIGWGGGAYWGAYGYPYGYAYPYPYAASPYPYYYRPYASGYSGGYYQPSAQLTTPSRAAQPYADAQAYMQRQSSSNGTAERSGFGTLSLRVTPADAEILIDGETWERSEGENRFSIDLAEGSHVIEVRKDGYGSYSRRVDVVHGQPITLNVGLMPRGPVPVHHNSSYSGATLVRR
jgi:hypothetical protein